MMRKNVIKLITAVSLFSTMAPLSVGASTLDDITAEQESVQKETTQLESKLTQQMQEVNELNNQITTNEAEIAEQEATIAKTAEEITAKEAELEEKFEAAKQQARDLQMNQMNQNAISMILSAESVSDIANTVIGLSTLFDASTTDIQLVEEEALALEDLKVEQEEQKVALDETKAELDEAKLAMDEKVKETQTLISENESELAALNQEKAAEEARIAAAEEAKALAAQKANEAKTVAVVNTKSTATGSSKSASNTSNKSSSSSQKSQPQQSTQQSSGRQITVNATAYSTNQPNLSAYTATGINLHQNPYVIAVDPSVIPLGSMVEVPGYGIRIAGDTGGAIKGNRIDIHITSLSAARAFGRRNMTITILN